MMAESRTHYTAQAHAQYPYNPTHHHTHRHHCAPVVRSGHGVTLHDNAQTWGNNPFSPHIALPRTITRVSGLSPPKAIRTMQTSTPGAAFRVPATPWEERQLPDENEALGHPIGVVLEQVRRHARDSESESLSTPRTLSCLVMPASCALFMTRACMTTCM